METWEVDQSVTSTAILSAGLCAVPSNSSLLKKLGLTTLNNDQRVMEEERKRCWHGQGWGQCRSPLGTQYYPGMPGCKWWHAYIPRQLLKEIVPDPLYR